MIVSFHKEDIRTNEGTYIDLATDKVIAKETYINGISRTLSIYKYLDVDVLIYNIETGVMTSEKASEPYVSFISDDGILYTAIPSYGYYNETLDETHIKEVLDAIKVYKDSI